MNEHVCCMWNFHSIKTSSATVLPDGCRDLIMNVKENECPQWYISPLFDHAELVNTEENSTIIGFRFKPGVKIAEKQLLDFIQNNNLYPDQVQQHLDDFLALPPSVDEALNCLASNVKSISEAARKLGVSNRTLQRLIIRNTSRSPGYWLQLARTRKAARQINQSANLAEIAELFGFADQSHMNKEFRRWFNANPTEILNSSTMTEQLQTPGYG